MLNSNFLFLTLFRIKPVIGVFFCLAGYGVEVESLNCKRCGFNITENNKLKTAITSLRERMSKEVKIVKVGTGLGVRFPNEIVKNYKLKKGEDILLKPEFDGLKFVTET